MRRIGLESESRRPAPKTRAASGYGAAMSSARVKAVDWYDTPRWYDIVFDVDTNREADFLEEVLRLHGPRRARAQRADILEPACGSGRLVRALARRGHAVVGFDRNEAMLDFARRRLSASKVAARVEHGDMASFRYDARFDLAHCLVSTFKYLLDEASARAHLECVSRALVPGGLYVLGFHLSDYARTVPSRERWVAARGGATVTCTTHVSPARRSSRLEDVRTRLVVERASGVMRSETRWQFRTYDARQVRRLFASVPTLEWIALHDFHYETEQVRTLDDGIMDCVFVLRKRGSRSRVNR